MCYGDYGLYFDGGSYSSVYVPPPMFVSPIDLVVYIPVIFLFSFHFIFCIPISWYTFPPVLLFPNCVHFIHDWVKIFGGVCICISSYAAYMCILKYVYLI